MTVNLTPQQIAWLERQVADGAFGSVEEAAQFYLSQRMAEEELDLATEEITPLLTDAEREIAEGRFISGDDFKARLQACIKTLEG